jgi:uncharacterized protein
MMRRIWWILLLATSRTAPATSFDCAKAKTIQEKAICSSKDLSALDDKLAATYRGVLAELSYEKTEVREGQRAWVQGMATQCKEDLKSDVLAGCLSKYYQARIAALQGMVSADFQLTSGDSDRLDMSRGTDLQALGITVVFVTNSGSEHHDLGQGWPQKVLPDTADWRAWNKALEAASRDWAVQSITDWRPNADPLLQVVFGHVSPWLVTASIERSWRVNERHHWYDRSHSVEFNWLLKEQRELKPEDIFRAGSGWEEELRTRVDNALRKELVVYDSPAHQPMLLRVVSSPRHWHFDSESLGIFELDSRELGADHPVSIKWDDLKPFLRQDIVIPKKK